jgi:hypothetical protein
MCKLFDSIVEFARRYPPRALSAEGLAWPERLRPVTRSRMRERGGALADAETRNAPRARSTSPSAPDRRRKWSHASGSPRETEVPRGAVTSMPTAWSTL